jgi:cardiolipin synthase
MNYQLTQYDNRNFGRGFDYFFDHTPPHPEATLLAGCSKSFERMLEAISAARTKVWLQMYIFDDDALGKRFERALAECVMRGVEVRVLCDGYGCRHSRHTLLRRLQKYGVRTALWSAPKSTRADCRNHRKILITDDIAFVGGVNIAVRYLHHWRDLCVEIRGESAALFERVFAEDWAESCGETLPFGSAPPHPAVGIVYHPDEMEEAVVQMIERAEQRVLVSTPYLIPTPRVERALTKRVAAGVKVQILIPRHSDTPLTGVASKEYARRLVESGVEVWLYTKGFNHAKVIVSDHCAMLGSMNLDYRSLQRNREIMAVFDGAVAECVAKDFEQSLCLSCLVKPRSSLFYRVAEWVLRPLLPLL